MSTETYIQYKQSLRKLASTQWSEAEQVLRSEGDSVINRAIEILVTLPMALQGQFSRTINAYGLEYDDLLAEGNLALVEAVHNWDKRKGLNLKNWCWTKVSFAMIDFVHAETTWEGKSSLLDADELIDLVDWEIEDSSDPNFEALAELQNILWVREHCTPREAELFSLMYVEGLTQSEAADDMGVRRQTANETHDKLITNLRQSS